MRARGFELLIGAFLLGSLTMHYDYEERAATYRADARADERRVMFRKWRQLARDEQRLKLLQDEIQILKREADVLSFDEAQSIESIEEMVERWLIMREVWRES